MRNSFFGRGHVCLSLLSLLAIFVIAWPQVIAAGDEPKLTRTEQKVVYEAQQDMAAKRYSEAREKLSAYLRQADGKVHYLVEFSLGNALILNNRPEEALSHYRVAANLNPSDIAIWQNLGKACYELARFDEAGESLARAHALTKPSSPALAYQAAVAYLQAKRPADARPLLERIVEAENSQPEPEWLEALLKVYLDLDQKDKALAMTLKLVSQKGQDPRMWQMLAHLYIERKAYEKAAAALEIKASLVEPTREEIERLGDLYRIASVPLKAARQYEKLLDDVARPKNVENAASAYLAARRADRAIEILKRGVGQKPNFRLWWLLAGALYEREDYAEAMEAFEQSIRHNPKHAQAYLMMGYCALRVDRVADAEAAFTKAADFPKQRDEAEKRLNEIGQYRRLVTSNQ